MATDFQISSKMQRVVALNQPQEVINYLISKINVQLEYQRTINDDLADALKLNHSAFELRKKLSKVKSVAAVSLHVSEELDWLSQHVDSIKIDYIERLQMEFSELSYNELKCCQYLVQGLTDKQIASIKKVSADAIKVMRYRIRKKMKVSSNKAMMQLLKNIN